jgi:hypothetical protein
LSGAFGGGFGGRDLDRISRGRRRTRRVHFANGGGGGVTHHLLRLFHHGVDGVVLRVRLGGFGFGRHFRKPMHDADGCQVVFVTELEHSRPFIL